VSGERGGEEKLYIASRRSFKLKQFDAEIGTIIGRYFKGRHCMM